jgi:hypothetical protein
MSRRLKSAFVGLLFCAILILVEETISALAAQILVLTVAAITAPFLIATVTKEFKKLWLGVALAACIGLHLAFLYYLRDDLPQQNSGGVILMGFIESGVLITLSALIRQHLSNLRSFR